LLLAVSLFTGAGGLDLGCEQAGFTTVAAVESNTDARATLAANRGRYFPGLADDAVLRDVIDVQPMDLRALPAISHSDVDLVHGGPPCTPFSKSGNWLEYKRTGADPKHSLLDEFARLATGLAPKALLMENVFGLAYQNHNRTAFERIQRGVDDAGYELRWRVLLAADYGGVPQLRQRLVCVALRRDLLDCAPDRWVFPWPRATHAGPHERRADWDASLPPHLTAGEALAEVRPTDNPPEPEEVVHGTHAQALHEVPPGDNYLFHTAKRGHPDPRYRWRARYWSFLLKLSPNRPSPTIQGQPGPWVGPFHWDSRRLRVAEVKRLMAIPSDFELAGDRRSNQLQLGNAVPPPLARAVAQAIGRELHRLGAATAPLASAA
jgi:DNA (cytosine-5)-methyltransferase 1